MISRAILILSALYLAVGTAQAQSAPYASGQEPAGWAKDLFQLYQQRATELGLNPKLEPALCVAGAVYGCTFTIPPDAATIMVTSFNGELDRLAAFSIKTADAAAAWTAFDVLISIQSPQLTLDERQRLLAELITKHPEGDVAARDRQVGNMKYGASYYQRAGFHIYGFVTEQ
jgi:hypothetical protein